MTESELSAVIEGIVPIVREHLTKSLGDMAQRVAAAEARLTVLGDLKDRTIVVETKLETAVSARFAAVDASLSALDAAGREVKAATQPMGELLQRLSAAESRLATLDDVKNRTTVLETKVATAPAAGGAELPAAALEGVREALEHKIGTVVGELGKDIGTLRERLSVVEVRAALPGPAGPAGANGRDGRDGHDGIALDDLSATLQADERTMVVRARVGGQIKDIGALTFPVELYRGVWVEGKTYEPGDAVTWAGSEWHSNLTTTSKPGDGSKDWTLKVKRGRDGRDGKDAPTVPVVRAGA